MPKHTTLAELKQSHAEVFETRRPGRWASNATRETVPRHTHEGTNVVFHVVEGHLELARAGGAYDLRAGAVIRVDGDCDVAPAAVTDTTALVVFAPATEPSDTQAFSIVDANLTSWTRRYYSISSATRTAGGSCDSWRVSPATSPRSASISG
jgi:quercetin dioxygenase-like cupin family protein